MTPWHFPLAILALIAHWYFINHPNSKWHQVISLCASILWFRGSDRKKQDVCFCSPVWENSNSLGN
jgi:hypothetical protein